MSKAEIPSVHQRYISCGPTTRIWDTLSSDWTSGQGLLAKSNYKVSTKWDIVNNCVVAVKSIPLSSQHDLDNSKKEFELMKQLHHRNILQVLDCVEPTSANLEELLIVMKYISDGSLLSYMEKFYTDTSNVNKCFFTPDSVFKFFVSLLSALDCLDKNHIIHRDIKMANLLYDSQSGIVILTDFDRSEQAAPEEVTLHTFTSNITRLPFRAPELVGDDLERSYSHKSDMWALGCTMIEIATGKNPWTEKPAWADSGVTDLMMKKLLLKDGKTPPIPDLIKNTTPVFAHVLQQCFLHNSSDRWSAAQALEYIQKADGGKYLSHIPSDLERPVLPSVTATTMTSNEYYQQNTTNESHDENNICILDIPILGDAGIVGGPVYRNEGGGSIVHRHLPCVSPELIERLRNFYQNKRFPTLSTICGQSDKLLFDDKWKMTKIRTTKEGTESRENVVLTAKQLVTQDLQGGKKVQVTLVEGQAGMGKSTMAKYLAREQLLEPWYVTLHVELSSVQRRLQQWWDTVMYHAAPLKKQGRNIGILLSTAHLSFGDSNRCRSRKSKVSCWSQKFQSCGYLTACVHATQTQWIVVNST